MNSKESEQNQRRPIDDLLDVARVVSQDPETANYKAKIAALEKARELQQKGLFPDDNSSPQPWTEEHDQRLDALITEVRNEYGLPDYPAISYERCR